MNKFAPRTILAIAIALGAAACAPAAPEAPATAISTAAAPAPQGIQASTIAETNKRVMQRFTAEFLPTGDAALAEQFLSPDVTIYFAGQKQQGRDTYLGLVAANRAAFPDLVWTVDQMVAEGDTVAIRYTMTGTHRGDFAGVAGTGKRVIAQSMAFYRLENGKIVQERAQLDLLAILQQVGAIPTK